MNTRTASAVPDPENPGKFAMADDATGQIIDNNRYGTGYRSEEAAYKNFGFQAVRDIDDKGEYYPYGETSETRREYQANQ
ncbi:MAG: hypothetical protein FWG25_06710 [Promicromonosporaceae bacterium]|nr:hypothetical protein [Promicromonosporaceae bacterium]